MTTTGHTGIVATCVLSMILTTDKGCSRLMVRHQETDHVLQPVQTPGHQKLERHHGRSQPMTKKALSTAREVKTRWM